MLTISEIRGRARTFSNEWKGETREDAERQSFWNDWFTVFGVSRRRFVSFEHHVKKLSGTTGRIDAFWPGQILIEHKSAGEDLDNALDQAEGYLLGLAEEELPRLIVLSNLETDEEVVLHPVLLGDRVDIDLRRAVGHVAQQPTEAIGHRQIACSVPRMIGAHLATSTPR